jgi:hypothetical protein
LNFKVSTELSKFFNEIEDIVDLGAVQLGDEPNVVIASQHPFELTAECERPRHAHGADDFTATRYNETG